MSTERLWHRAGASFIAPFWTVCFLAALLVWLSFPPGGPFSSRGSANSPQATAYQNYQSYLTTPGKRPLIFELNAGQTDPSVRFLARAQQANFFFTPSEVTLILSHASKVQSPKTKVEVGNSSFNFQDSELSTETVRMRFLGANAKLGIEGGELLPGKVSYLLGNDPSLWRTNLPTYSAITYPDLYPGISLAYSGQSSALKGTFAVAPHADPSIIRWQYEGMRVSVSRDGSLQITNPNSELTTHNSQLVEQAPLAWQEKGGRRIPVAIHYLVTPDNSIHFEIGAYDPALPLTIDPTLGYSTYLGGTGNDAGTGIAVVGSNAYITGLTASVDFPLANPRQPTYGGGNTDVFVSVFNADGTGLLYSTYLGGSGSEDSWAIAADAEGHAYITGYTDSTDFPLRNPLQPTNRGYRDSFLSKLSPDGSALVYSTYLGGTGWDEAWCVDLDRDGFVYIAGTTSSTNFPTRNPIQATNRGGSDAFLTKINREGSALVYSTYLGGGDTDTALGVKTDRDRNAYITGGTESDNFPTRNPYQASNRGGQDVYLTKVDRDGTHWVYSTYLGSSGNDVSWAIAVSEAGNAYLTGYAGSNDFPQRNPVQPGNGGGQDGFVTAFNAAGSALIYSTYLGGNGGYDAGYGIAVDPTGSAYVGGITSSTNFPLANPLQLTNHGGDDAFISKFSPAGAPLIYSTYLGGSSGDFVYGTAIDASGNTYITGHTDSSDFPTVNPFQPNRAGGHEAFVARIVGPPIPTATPTPTYCPFNFSDVRQTDYFYEAVRYLFCAGAISGYADQTFRPYNNTTRGQLCKIIVLAEGWPLYTPSQPTFSDVPPTSPFYPYVETAHSRGTIAGYADGTFRPGNDVTRGQLCKIIVLASGWEIDTSGGPHFTDVSPNSPFYPYIETAFNHEAISGYADGTFRPGSSAIRGQICKIVYNALDNGP